MQTERLARNEAAFRAVNEQISDIARSYRDTDTDFEFLCECSTVGCRTVIALSLPEYDRVRARPDGFAIAPGHDQPAIERVIEKHSRFWLVEKIGEAGEIARRLHPR